MPEAVAVPEGEAVIGATGGAPEDPPTPTLEDETIRQLRIENYQLRGRLELLTRYANGLEARLDARAERRRTQHPGAIERTA